ncbi:ataxin-1a [Hoplias malabaricus]|uniref:ataxin-1a n=1 Tax=Hoplias malabaricus TaxID=27720 RepID=UPI003462A6A7
MKSNQERSNECLPPKKREIPASTLPSDEKPVVMAPASESQRTGNLAWLASVASGQESGGQRMTTSAESKSPQYKPLVEYPSPCSTQSTRSATAVTTVPAVYTSPLSQHGGTIQYTPLPPNLHFISPSYAAPYTSYISPLIPPPPAPSTNAATSQRHSEAYTSSTNSSSSKSEHPLCRPLAPPMSDSVHPPQYVQMSTPRTAPSPHAHAHLPLHLHPQHTLALSGPSQVLLQYADAPAPKKEETRVREVLNGEMEKGQRFSLSESIVGKQSKGVSSTQQHHIHQQQQQHYEARHMVLPAEYVQDSNSAMRTSLVLVPNSHTSSSVDPGGTLDKLPPPPPPEKGGICVGKPINRTPSSSSSSTSLPFPPPPLPVDGLKAAVTTLSPHTVIQTTHNVTEPLSLGLTSTNFYPTHQPIIGYIAGTGQQQPLSYHTSLPQHLVIPGTPVIIPVSGADATATSTAAAFPAALPHAFVTSTTPKGETFDSLAPYPHPAGAVVQAQLHLPMVPAPASLLATPPPPSAPSLPPYFAKGSIIQLADGELKRVEDLKTEDFIQSAEISSELKIDSSTVERIDSSHTSNFAIIQFAVGEHRSQVSVEVLVEYPFFVFGQGWSSCCPDRTTQLLELPCAKLSVGDVCISLTLKNLKNGSLKKSQGQIPDASGLGPPFKPPKAPLGGTRGGTRHTEQENGLSQGGPTTQANAENGELRFGDRGTCKAQPSIEVESNNKPTGRKRRWSAPEGRKVEKSEEEPPLTLPKPSFIPQEVKISIEGRSNIGK